MEFFIPLAVKSLLVAGLALVILRLARRRSAAERSWIAHVGLTALLALPLALALPQIHVPSPAILDQTTETSVPTAGSTPVVKDSAKGVASTAATFPDAAAAQPEQSIDWGFWAYVVPAALLLLLTLTALFRLVLLKAKANVLVEPRWLSALAHAQRRMGFKHGTALLTSDDLRSPISWGLMRPVILLNSEAADANAEAEAIIAHELAHVANLDWLKLLLARVATSIFWFNPLVWMLAREAHQLREEAADDAVLSSDIDDTDYAKLLVGIARHECRGLLIGAHGVAPSRGSLARRIARVLDTSSPRGPVARSFALGVFVGAACIAAPLAALTLAPKDASAEDKLAGAVQRQPYYPDTGAVIGPAVGTAVTNALSSVPSLSQEARRDLQKDLAGESDFVTQAPSGALITRKNGILMTRAPSGATVTVYPPDANGRQKIVSVSPGGARAVTYADADEDQDSIIERAIETKALGLSPQYGASLRAVAPWLRDLTNEDLIELKAVGVTPEYVRDLSRAFGKVDKDTITEARAVGLSGEYVRRMAAAGYRGDVDDYVAMRAVGVTPEYAASFRKRGIKVLDTDQLVEMKAHGIGPEDLDRSGQPPPPPAPPRIPADG